MTFFRKPNIFNRDLHILMSFLQLSMRRAARPTTFA